MAKPKLIVVIVDPEQLFPPKPDRRPLRRIMVRRGADWIEFWV